MCPRTLDIFKPPVIESRTRLLKLWYVHHQRYACHYSLVHGLSKAESKDKKNPSINEVTKKLS
jgi:hypothetical protein